ncbi:MULTISPECIES: hypothetical protein [Streptomyces]|uniref:hypothetical protein n=1 Tax=Streptomyces TaxID=1883 RepID=UPI001F60F849|nr:MULTISPECIES: hypothetical protein [Streptomyces]
MAANLRTTLTGVGALLPEIEHGSGLTSSWGGLLSTLPLLTFAATSPLVARASHRRSRLAWQVTLFMGLQSLAFYTAVTWLPSILIDRGTSGTAAGWMLFYYQVVSLAANSLLPLLTRSRHDQRWTAAGASLLVAAGFTVLVAAPALSVLACTLLGLGGGACLVLALTFQSQRADSAGEAAAPTGMAQSIGYLVAAAGPYSSASCTTPRTAGRFRSSYWLSSAPPRRSPDTARDRTATCVSPPAGTNTLPTRQRRPPEQAFTAAKEITRVPLPTPRRRTRRTYRPAKRPPARDRRAVS